MKIRILTGIGLVLVGVPVVYFCDFFTFPLFFAAMAAIGAFEFLRAGGLHRNLWLSIPAIAVAVAGPVGFYLWHFFDGEVTVREMIPAAFGLLVVLLLWYFLIAVLKQGDISFASVTFSFVTAAYVFCGFSALVALSVIGGDSRFVYLVFFGSWGSDMCAYFTGVLLGKHKLIPRLSPKKTVEGAIGGILGGGGLTVLYAYLFSLIVGDVHPRYLALFFVGMILSVISQIGDLLASLVKREVGIKDYGKLFPGHGGVMDRFDSVVAVASVLCVICLIYPAPLF